MAAFGDDSVFNLHALGAIAECYENSDDDISDHADLLPEASDQDFTMANRDYATTDIDHEVEEISESVTPWANTYNWHPSENSVAFPHEFTGNSSINVPIDGFQPIDFFNMYLTTALVDLMVRETN
ncbi:uncharacterized protein TRIADDRAFT_62965, partial [Trichoplax adhaerens]